MLPLAKNLVCHWLISILHFRIITCGSMKSDVNNSIKWDQFSGKIKTTL
jgi:hypothetical protein